MQADYNTPYGIIYKATAPSGKAYVGQTTRTLDKRRIQHSTDKKCRALASAIGKYGVAAFRWEVLARCGNQAALDATEAALIVALNTATPHGYNIREGGNGKGKHSPETRAKMSASAHRRNADTEWRQRHDDIVRRKCQTPERSEQMKAVRREVLARSGFRKKLSASVKKAFQDPAKKARLSAGIRRSRANNPDIGRRIGDAARKRWATPAFREKMRLVRAQKAAK